MSEARRRFLRRFAREAYGLVLNFGRPALKEGIDRVILETQDW